MGIDLIFETVVKETRITSLWFSNQKDTRLHFASSRLSVSWSLSPERKLILSSGASFGTCWQGWTHETTIGVASKVHYLRFFSISSKTRLNHAHCPPSVGGKVYSSLEIGISQVARLKIEADIIVNVVFKPDLEWTFISPNIIFPYIKGGLALSRKWSYFST